MADNPFRMPRDSRITGQDGRLTMPFQHYLGGIETLAERQSAAIDDTSGATLVQLEATVNALKAALRTALLMKS